MLKVGYPWSVKRRVMGRNGHSNEVVILRLYPERAGWLFTNTRACPFEQA